MCVGVCGCVCAWLHKTLRTNIPIVLMHLCEKLCTPSLEANWPVIIEYSSFPEQ